MKLLKKARKKLKKVKKDEKQLFIKVFSGKFILPKCLYIYKALGRFFKKPKIFNISRFFNFRHFP
jgi:hypothetical protein